MRKPTMCFPTRFDKPGYTAIEAGIGLLKRKKKNYNVTIPVAKQIH